MPKNDIIPLGCRFLLLECLWGHDPGYFAVNLKRIIKEYGSFRNLWSFVPATYKKSGCMRYPNTFFGEPGREAAKPPNFVEGYPRLNFKEAAAAVAAGTPLCVWENVDVARRGHALVSFDGEELEVSYFIVPFYGEASVRGEAMIALRRIALGQGRTRRVMVCPECNLGAASLVFFRGWKCRKCQGLIHRSSAIATKVRRTLRERALEFELEQGRPKGVHEATMQKKRDELEKLREIAHVRGRAFVSTIQEKYVFTSTWTAPDEDELYQE